MTIRNITPIIIYSRWTFNWSNSLDFKINCKIDDDLINVIKSKLKVVSIKPIRKTLKYLLIIFFKSGKDRYRWISKKGKKNYLQSQIILIQIV